MVGAGSSKWQKLEVQRNDIQPAALLSGNCNTLCPFFNRLKTHRVVWEIPAGETPNNESCFPAHSAIFKTKDKSPCAKEAGLKQTYYGNRGGNGPGVSPCGLDPRDSRLCRMWQERCSSLLCLCRFVGQQFPGNISNPTILPVLVVPCFQIVGGERCDKLGGISLVLKGQSTRISPLVPKEK